MQSVHSSTYNALPSEIPGYGQTNGDIIVGNDVWFGENVTVMSGVNIGDGAVVAANSTVTSDVIPYSIVGGNPARLIKYRFDKATIEALSEIKWWNLDDVKLNQLIPLLVQPDVNKFIEKYRLMIAT